uniref:Trypsin n=1 Tax=Lygus lineolaris TaxID=50650 RepID=A0A184WFY7_LYGLI|nr:trypsin precursor [Lygus lineolaris]
MRVWIPLFCILVAAFAEDDVSEDSSEHGVVKGTKGTNCRCGWANKDSQRIVGGKETKVNEYPMMAGLFCMDGLFYTPRNVLFCGGTVITRWHVVTAAHCVEPVLHVPEDVQIVLGEHDQSKVDESPYTKVYRVKEMVNHPDYFLVGHRNDYRNDIAVILSETRFEFNDYVGPACMPTGAEVIVGSKLKVLKLKVLGWGKLSVDGPASKVLMKVNLNVVPIEQCAKVYDRVNTTEAKQVCTHHPRKDACQGDSGGPLLWLDRETNRYTLVAAVSHGRGCAEGHPAVNTNIIYYRDWIQKIIRETKPEGRICKKQG